MKTKEYYFGLPYRLEIIPLPKDEGGATTPTTQISLSAQRMVTEQQSKKLQKRLWFLSR